MIVTLNNKCNLTRQEFLSYKKQLQQIKTDVTLILCPCSLFLNDIDLDNIKIGAQNVSCTECGSYTGEISATQLKSMNVSYCIVGHSERRKYQQETDREINEKIKNLLKVNIIPILCVGEEKEERQKQIEKQVITKDLEEATQGLSEEEKSKIIIAYEPIWSIGTGIIPQIREIDDVVELMKDKFPNNKILYGGSANEENIETLNQISKIDGYLVGGLSLKPEQLKIFLKKLKK